jgi:rare lipoprotein A
MKLPLILGMAAVFAAPLANAKSIDDARLGCLRFGSDEAPLLPLNMQHRLAGLASYYSASLAGTLTANGERYFPKKMTAAHLTLPLGTWVELTARATGKTIRVRVNDRGPYVKKFAIDLSRAAARALGVDVAEDRWVDIRIIAPPAE